MGERKFAQMVLVTWPRWSPCPYMVKKKFSKTKRSMTLNFGMHHQVLEYYQVCSNDDPGLTFTYFMARSNLVPYASVWEKVEQWFFQKLLSSMIWNLQQMNEVTIHFCWHQSFVPWGLSAPALGLYTCIKPWKQLYKIRLKRDVF